MKWPVYEQVEQHRILSNSILDWTMVLPPMLTHDAERGRYRVDGETLPYYSISISRADVARFMIQQLTSTDWLRRGVFVSN